MGDLVGKVMGGGLLLGPTDRLMHLHQGLAAINPSSPPLAFSPPRYLIPKTGEGWRIPVED